MVNVKTWENYISQVFFAGDGGISPYGRGYFSAYGQGKVFRFLHAHEAVHVLSHLIFTSLKSAGDGGIEPPPTVLETVVLPLN
jgi:hypothetical protein